MNRIGDWGFLVGMFLVFATFGTLDFAEVAAQASAMPVETVSFGVLSLIALLLFVGATGKSAQIPLYVWLPDAMEGPTPVSALIHAATMVTAGVYMVGRTAVLFSHAPMTMGIVAAVGVLTALVAASIGLVQNDIKRVLARPWQLGYMFVAMGVGAFAAGIFHLVTHAFFKALLFLGSGAVIHAMAGQQDMRGMGGLKRFLPITYVTMFVGTLAIAGVPPFSGFFSKDEILYRTFLENRLLWAVAVVTALMTAFYMFRLMSMTFLGAYRGPAWAHAPHPASSVAAADRGAIHPGDPFAHGRAAVPDHEVSHGPADHAATHDAAHGGHGAWHGPHEAPPAMRWVLVALAAGAVVAGFVGVPAALGGGNAIEHFLAPSFESSGRLTSVEGVAPGFLASVTESGVAGAGAEASDHAAQGAVAAGEHPVESHGTASHHLSRAGELGLMAFSVIVALLGMLLAYRFYVARPEISERLARRFATAHTVLSNKYYVDEVYDATVVQGTLRGASGLWSFDRRVLTGRSTGRAGSRSSPRGSHTARQVLRRRPREPGGRRVQRFSFVLRRVQTGSCRTTRSSCWSASSVFVSVYLMLGEVVQAP